MYGRDRQRVLFYKKKFVRKNFVFEPRNIFSQKRIKNSSGVHTLSLRKIFSWFLRKKYIAFFWRIRPDIICLNCESKSDSRSPDFWSPDFRSQKFGLLNSGLTDSGLPKSGLLKSGHPMSRLPKSGHPKSGFRSPDFRSLDFRSLDFRGPVFRSPVLL